MFLTCNYIRALTIIINKKIVYLYIIRIRQFIFFLLKNLIDDFEVISRTGKNSKWLQMSLNEIFYSYYYTLRGKCGVRHWPSHHDSYGYGMVIESCCRRSISCAPRTLLILNIVEMVRGHSVTYYYRSQSITECGNRLLQPDSQWKILLTRSLHALL